MTAIKLFRRAIQVLLTFAMLIGIAACPGGNNSSSLGALSVNGPGVDGSVPAGSKRLYTLSAIAAGGDYTLRTTVTETKLSMLIYRSEDDYKSGSAPVVPSSAVLQPIITVPDYPPTSYYETHFIADTSGNYLVVLSASAGALNNDVFFYDLRLMSSSSLISQATLTVGISITETVGASSVHIFSGGTDTYTINLLSTVTATASYPQIFIYGDKTLSLQDSLLTSSVTDSMNFIVTDFSRISSDVKGTVRATDTNNTLATGVNIIIPSTMATPFIVVKGTAAAQYTLSVKP